MKIMMLAALAACGAVACGEDDGGTETESQAETLKACAMDFTADVRSGPNAGLHLEGTLMVFEREGGDPVVAFARAGVEGVEADHLEASFADGRVTLRFPLEQGTIVGTGPMSTDLSACPDELVGDLTGPTEGDAGDWVAPLCTSFSLCVFVAKATCFAGCSYAGYSDAACNQTCGTNN